MNIPMNEKYVDEAVGVYFIFGTNDLTGQVYVASADKDIMCLDEEIAEKVVQLQAEFRTKLYALLCNFSSQELES